MRIQLDEAIKSWEFEKAAVIRDQIKEISGE
nr:UvrB/UvrC motif-containing protein [bacterium]